MTDKPTPEQIQRACDLAMDADHMSGGWSLKDYGLHGCFTALADTIAQLDAKDAMIDGQAALIATLTAERDKATADLGEIDRIALHAGWTGDDNPKSDNPRVAIAAIAAPYRVETDPLVAEIGRQGRQPKAVCREPSR